MNRTPQITLTERQVLRFLCQGFHDDPVREAIWDHAGIYRWHEAEHQAIFDVLSTLRQCPPAVIRAQLPAAMTRLGFPDADWEDLFHPHGLSRTEAEEIIARWLKLP